MGLQALDGHATSKRHAFYISEIGFCVSIFQYFTGLPFKSTEKCHRRALYTVPLFELLTVT